MNEAHRNILNITNGDCAVKIMQAAKVPGETFPWRDILHEGPVPGGLSMLALSKIREQFIIDKGCDAESVKSHYKELHATLNRVGGYNEIILWFEHDLYDQLQILQILHWFESQGLGDLNLSMICTTQYLGLLNAKEMASLPAHKNTVSTAQLKLAHRAWEAFCSNTPTAWLNLLTTNTSALPFLEGAIHRLLEEYPSCKTGLSRTAEQALQIIKRGCSNPLITFTEYQKTEERRFLGDLSFWGILDVLIHSTPALIKVANGETFSIPPTPQQQLSITAAGEETFTGGRHFLATNKENRWLGGVHLDSNNTWCWDSKHRTLRSD